MLDSIIRLYQPLRNLTSRKPTRIPNSSKLLLTIYLDFRLLTIILGNYDFPDLRIYTISTVEFNILIEIVKILRQFEIPTIKLQASTYPTLYYTLFYYYKFRKDLAIVRQEIKDPKINDALKAATTKLNKYFKIDKNKPALIFSIILDPRRKLSGFPYIGFSEDTINDIKTSFNILFIR